MKKTLFFCLFLFISANSISQNAFYNTRKILAWRDEVKKLNSLSNNDTTRATARKKRDYLDSITSMVFYYTGENKWETVVKYPAVAELLDFITTQLFDTATMKTAFYARGATRLTNNFLDIEPAFRAIDDAGKELRAYRDSFYWSSVPDSFFRHILHAAIVTIPNVPVSTSTDSTITAVDSTAPITFTTIQITATNQNDYKKELLDVMKQKEQFFLSKRKHNERIIHEAYNRLMKAVQKNKIDLAMALLGEPINMRMLNSREAGISTAVKNSFDNSTTDALNQNQQAIQQLKNFSFPSQSDIIDALAIYLAKRVKQEAVLAFTDQLRKSLKADTLLNVFFPETKRLFMSLPDYDFPRFGTAWRYAISKDFIQLPENFFKSHYPERWFRNDYDYFSDVYQVATLIRKKYTFLEIVEDLQSRLEENGRKDTLRTSALKQFVNITHVVNKELFNNDSTSLYWINADLWMNATDEEFEIFWALVNEKYPRLIEMVKFKKGDTRYDLTLQTAKQLRLWIKKVLGALNKFQANQDELAKATAKNPEKNWEFQVSTYWDNVHDIINVVIDNDLVNQKYKATLAKVDITIDRLFNVYEALQQKNYASAVEETLYMIETFIKVPQGVKQVDWKALFEEKRFRLKDGEAALRGGQSLDDVLSKVQVIKLDTITTNAKALLLSLIEKNVNLNKATMFSTKKSNIDTINAIIERYATKYGHLKGIKLTNNLELIAGSESTFYQDSVKPETSYMASAVWRRILDNDTLRLRVGRHNNYTSQTLMEALAAIRINKDSTTTLATGSDVLNSLIKICNDTALRSLACTTAVNMDTINTLIQQYAKQYEIFKGIGISDKLELQLDNSNPLYEKLVEKHPGSLAAVRKAAAIFQDIISAGNSQELSKVIETYAMAPGSYKLKRRSSFSIDLNAYFGVYAGVEWAKKDSSVNKYSSGAGVFGITAPIGISFSWAGYANDMDEKAGGYTVKRRKKLFSTTYTSASVKRFKGTSHTLSLGIIDIGAVVSYRLSNSDASKPLPDKLRWGQVLSPSLFYRYGIRNTPLTLSGGVQFAPLLRTIGNQNASNTWRASIGIIMDLPLLNFYRPK